MTRPLRPKRSVSVRRRVYRYTALCLQNIRHQAALFIQRLFAILRIVDRNQPWPKDDVDGDLAEFETSRVVEMRWPTAAADYERAKFRASKDGDASSVDEAAERRNSTSRASKDGDASPANGEAERRNPESSIDADGSSTNVERKRQHAIASSELGLSRLPLEIRMRIFQLVFPFESIHLARTSYRSSDFDSIRLEAYPCVFDQPHKEQYLCKCLLSPLERQIFTRSPVGPGSRVRNFKNPSSFPAPRPADRDSGSGLWELNGSMYASNEFCEIALSSVLQSCTIQVFDLDTIILASITMPRRHFNTIHSLYLNAKYIAPCTSFTDSTRHFPPSYRRFLSAVPLLPAPCRHQPRLDGPLGKHPYPKRSGYLRPISPTPGAESTDLELYPSAWRAACHILSEMQSLNVLRVQLCHSAFAEVLFSEWPERVVSHEDWVFAPLVDVARKRGSGLGLFEVEVDWPDGGDGWDVANRELGFDLVRVGPRARCW